MNPDEEVAYGTAVQGATRTGEGSSQVQDLTFDQNLENAILPSGLQTLACGYGSEFIGKCFNQNLEVVTLPSGLQTLTLGYDSEFNQGLEQVTLPSGLLTLTFDQRRR